MNVTQRLEILISISRSQTIALSHIKKKKS